jgi:hypothetical protein
MYCSACGSAVAQGLSYCNFCGAQLMGVIDKEPELPKVRPELLIAAMFGLFVFGLLVIGILMGLMKNVLDLPVGQVLGFTLLPFLLLLLLEGVFLRLLFRGKRGTRERGETVRLKGQATKELGGADAHALPEHMPSITEHTTRAFAPLPNERTSK